jgi:hypothetical protein
MDSIPPLGHALAMGARDNCCNGLGGPTLATGVHDDGKVGGGPALTKQRKRRCLGKGNCGGGDSSDGDSVNGDDNDDGNGSSGSDNNDEGGDDKDNNISDDDHNGGNGGDGGGGCNTATAVGIDTTSQQSTKSGN